MLEHERLIKALTREEAECLIDIKFFLGSNRDITQADLCRETKKAVDQISRGQISAVGQLDSNIKKISIEKFLR